MDSVVSWFMAVALSLIGSVWFLNKVDAELKRNRAENDEFFRNKEFQENYRKNKKL